MRARFAVAAVLVCALSACTAAKDTSGTTAPPAPEALEAAINSWIESDTGRFTFIMGQDNDFVIASTGDYRLDDQLLGMTQVTRGDDTLLGTETVRDDEQEWTRTGKDPENIDGCWSRVKLPKADQASEGTVGSSTAVTAQMAVLAQAEGVEWEAQGTVLTATTDLYALVQTLGETSSDLALDPDAGHRADIVVLLDEGEVVAWRTDLASILESVLAAGVEITPEMEQLIGLDVEVPVTTGFSDLGAKAEIERPKKKDYFDFSADPDTLKRNRTACNSPDN